MSDHDVDADNGAGAEQPSNSILYAVARMRQDYGERAAATAERRARATRQRAQIEVEHAEFWEAVAEKLKNGSDE